MLGATNLPEPGSFPGIESLVERLDSLFTLSVGVPPLSNVAEYPMIAYDQTTLRSERAAAIDPHTPFPDATFFRENAMLPTGRNLINRVSKTATLLRETCAAIEARIADIASDTTDILAAVGTVHSLITNSNRSTRDSYGHAPAAYPGPLGGRACRRTSSSSSTRAVRGSRGGRGGRNGREVRSVPSFYIPGPQ